MDKYKILTDELQLRKSREEKILYGASGIKTFDEYKYCLGRIHILREISNLIEECKNNDRV